MVGDELEILFGPVVEPQKGGVRHWEENQSLKCYELNQSSVQQLFQLLALAESGGLGPDILQAVTLLWIINATGDLIFGLEETVVQATGLRRPRMRGTPLGATVKPLGHPLLVNGSGGRIGGELYIDDGDDDALTWVLNNQSGRYGLHADRKSKHLDNAADRFRLYKLPIVAEFISAAAG
ncbi:hypothetical protein [Bradyrhizobium lupini]